MSAKDFGTILDLTNLVKAKRGAEKTYEPGLLTLLGMLATNPAVIVTAWTVLRGSFKTSEAFTNERQKYGAMIRSHVDHLVETGVLPAGSKVSINWHPELGHPQVTIKLP